MLKVVKPSKSCFGKGSTNQNLYGVFCFILALLSTRRRDILSISQKKINIKLSFPLVAYISCQLGSVLIDKCINNFGMAVINQAN